MSTYSTFLRQLTKEVFGPEANSVFAAARPPYRYSAVLALDDEIGGASVRRLGALLAQNLVKIADRDVFRPLQYCSVDLADFSEWSTRNLVYMSSLHIESLVKRISETSRFPLGRALGERLAKQRIAPGTYEKLKRLTSVYNAAKHDVDHEFGTHLYSKEDGLLVYFIARKLGLRLYEQANLKTDIRLFRRSTESFTGPGGGAGPNAGGGLPTAEHS